jgi:tetratricopeptide (TPR) repeat protein
LRRPKKAISREESADVSSDKLTRKEIRNPDPFVRVTSTLWAKLIQRQKWLGLGLAGLFLVLVAGFAIQRSSQRRTIEAGGALSRALETARRAIEGSPEASRDDEGPVFKSAQEKNEEIVRQLGEVKGKHPGTEAARMASFVMADSLFRLGKLDEAAAAYQEYLNTSAPGDSLRALAQEGLGYIHESRKEWEKALESFDAMARESEGEPTKALAAFQRARILEQWGKKQEAANEFQQVKDEHKTAPAARQAGDRLALLAAQGITPALAVSAAPAPAASAEKK